MSLSDLKEKKNKGQKISMVTCYDFTSAKILSETSVDIILVGDSAAMVMHGFDDTIPATLEMMETHISAVKRGAPKKFIVGDLPFLSYRKSLSEGVDAVHRLVKAGASAVKLEGFDGNEEFVRTIVQSGVPVMGHVGLTPQFVNAFGGFKVQGRSEEGARKIMEDAKGFEKAGAFSVVLECVPAELAGEITSHVRFPTIGIGAGANCDGQVLVWQDLLGLNASFKPKFVRHYMNAGEMIKAALEHFHEDVCQQKFPNPEEAYR